MGVDLMVSRFEIGSPMQMFYSRPSLMIKLHRVPNFMSTYSGVNTHLAFSIVSE